MKKITLDEWEKKYVVGPIERFDQKNVMFSRPMWDPKIKDLMDDWSSNSPARDKPGFRVEEMALRKASDSASRIFSLFNTSKPNPSPIASKIKATMAATNHGRVAIANPPESLMIDATDTARMSLIIKKVAMYFGADIVGICRLDRRWVYSRTYTGQAAPGLEGGTIGESTAQEIPEEYQYVVVMGYEMEYDLYRYYNSSIATAATGMGYARMDFTNALLSEYIRNLGYKAINCTRNDVALSVPLAMQAGLGDLARNGLLITPQFGPRVRLSKVITDLPLEPDTPIDFGVTEFCLACEKCADSCPSQSIMTGDRTTEINNESNNSGALKWPINAETCRTYWARAKRGGGCTACISCCPYNKPHTWPHRTVRWLTDHTRWADPLFVKGDDLLGYGKPRKPDDFWEEWQPGNGNGQNHRNNHR